VQSSVALRALESLPEQNARGLLTHEERNRMNATLSRILPSDSDLRDLDVLLRNTKHENELTIAAELCSSWHVSTYDRQAAQRRPNVPARSPSTASSTSFKAP
jgi:hypothetical protein